MKRRKTIFQLLSAIRAMEKISELKVHIKSGHTGDLLYEGDLLHVPYVACSSYVLRYEGDDKKLIIISTYEPYGKESLP